MSIITLLTDFGLADAYVGVMKGVVLGIAPDSQLVDLSHRVPPQDVRAGAFLLMTAYAYFPAGTVHLAVVDPGVGTERRIVAIRAGGHLFVGPDNGLLRWAVDRAGGAETIVAVENPAYRLSQTSTTFHGRDVIAPAAAHLATGVPLGALGPPVASLTGNPFPQPQRRANALIGEIVYVDHYGNCITNLPHPAPATTATTVEVAGRRLPLVATYAARQPGDILAVTGSSGYVEIAIPNGNAAQRLSLTTGTEVVLQP